MMKGGSTGGIPAMTLRERIWLVMILLLAAGMKLWLIVGKFVPFNSDESVVALMARHILQGERPIFFYGQAYMGSLDAFLVAGGFSVFGQQVWVIRLVQSLLYLGFLLISFLIGREISGNARAGLLSASLLSIPTVNISLYTTTSLGGYGEALLIGSLLVWLSLRLGRKLLHHHTPGLFWEWFLIGFLAGLGFWAFGLSLVFSLPSAIYLLYIAIKASNVEIVSKPPGKGWSVQSGEMLAALKQLLRFSGNFLAAACVGVVLGALPVILYALQNSLVLITQELSGSAIAGVKEAPWIFQVGQHLLSLLVLGGSVMIGARPPWGVEWLAMPLLPFVMFFWIIVLIHSFQKIGVREPSRPAWLLVFGVGLTVVAGFIFTPFGADPSGRYFVPLALPMVLFAGSLILHSEQRLGRWASAIIASVLIFNFWGTLQSGYRFPPGITTQFYAPAQVDQYDMPQLISFLRQEGETRGYSNYWVSYPLAFLSQEELIYIPRLPYHPDLRYTERDDRYEPYRELVESAERVAYITTLNPALDEHLRTEFTKLNIYWKETQIGDFRVFYALSRLVKPQEVGLGETTP